MAKDFHSYIKKSFFLYVSFQFELIQSKYHAENAELSYVLMDGSLVSM